MKKLILLLATLLSTSAWGQKPNAVDVKTPVVPTTVVESASVLTGNDARTIYISGPIRGGIIDQAQQLLNLTKHNKDPIFLVLNSPGGAVLPGMQFLQSMRIAQRAGVEINCVVPVFAASMAFQIFAECDKRYAFETSLLLWHPMSMGGASRLTHDKVKKISDSFSRLEAPFIRTLRDVLKVSDEVFYKHYFWETYHTGLSLHMLSPGFMTLVSNVDGISNIFSMATSRSRNTRGLVGPQWIAPGWEQFQRGPTRLDRTKLLRYHRKMNRSL